MKFFDQASKFFTDSANKVQKKTGDSIAVVKLKNQIRVAQNDIDELFKTLGGLVYAASIDGTSPDISVIVDKVTALKNSIVSCNEELDRLNDVRRCPQCGSQISRGARFCPQCGSALPEEVEPEVVDEPEKCPQCGAERGDSNFCSACGFNFAAVDAEEPTETEE